MKNLNLTEENIRSIQLCLTQVWELQFDDLFNEVDPDMIREGQCMIDAAMALGLHDSVARMQKQLIEVLISRLEAIRQEGMDI